jgi:hypothetical protein
VRNIEFDDAMGIIEDEETTGPPAGTATTPTG